MQTRDEKNEYNRQYYQKNKDRLMANHAKYREAHREERRQADKEYKKSVRGTARYKLRTRWYHMISRCEKSEHKDYANYGGRGIKVCDEWKSFEAFMDWAIHSGFDETLSSYECTLDRIDVNGNYEPSNCRWVNMKIQQNNKRRTLAQTA